MCRIVFVALFRSPGFYSEPPIPELQSRPEIGPFAAPLVLEKPDMSFWHKICKVTVLCQFFLPFVVGFVRLEVGCPV